ncbi:hypothetical protein Pmani_036410 [Petrolisthes manimaculis]|uniref:Uncharacterized protein n=1 Tax=Petrolisthes manimaculis TaxID=1843537 RepID=A0AAE1NJS3_9EUCA|nr:hypothetical protein Pmani_036410 [Petrolisthes manimaculis]
MFQWVEEEATGQTEETPGLPSDNAHTYTRTWRDRLVDSDAFAIPNGHTNPKSLFVESEVQVADTVSVGVYRLSPHIIANTFTHYTPFSGDEQPQDPAEIKLHGGMYYHSEDIYGPRIGDVRVQFYFAGRDGDLVSIIGQQIGDTIHPHTTTNGRQLLLIQAGKRTVKEMFETELCCCEALRDARGLLWGSATFTLSVCVSLVIVGGAWATYRPGLALIMLGLAATPFIKAASMGSRPQCAPGSRRRRILYGVQASVRLWQSEEEDVENLGS